MGPPSPKDDGTSVPDATKSETAAGAPGALRPPLIHPSAWKGRSANFVPRGFSEGRQESSKDGSFGGYPPVAAPIRLPHEHGPRKEHGHGPRETYVLGVRPPLPHRGGEGEHAGGRPACQLPGVRGLRAGSEEAMLALRTEARYRGSWGPNPPVPLSTLVRGRRILRTSC